MSRVLIVEDEEHLAAGLRLNLEAEGFDVDVEENGQVALERLTTGPSAGRLQTRHRDPDVRHLNTVLLHSDRQRLAIHVRHDV